MRNFSTDVPRDSILILSQEEILCALGVRPHPTWNTMASFYREINEDIWYSKLERVKDETVTLIAETLSLKWNINGPYRGLASAVFLGFESQWFLAGLTPSDQTVFRNFRSWLQSLTRLGFAPAHFIVDINTGKGLLVTIHDC